MVRLGWRPGAHVGSVRWLAALLVASAATASLLIPANAQAGVVLVRASWSHAALRHAAIVAPGIPTRLRIPALGIDARTRPEGLVGGAPDVPANGVDAGWYMFGPRPGLAGNAVIDGHRDTTAGPAVFWRLRLATPGDRLYVTDGNGVVRTFKVVSVSSYTLTQAPLRRIYGPSSEAHLNLITCDGTWLPARQTYDHRLVVYASLVA